MNMHDIIIAEKLAGGGGGTPPVIINKTVTENGTYQASSDSADGYSEVTVNVRSIDGIPLSSANGSYIFNDLGLTWETSAEEQTV